MNLSEWALEHRGLMVFCMGLLMLAGLRAYFHLGRNEDPEFTVKTMVVRAYLPGAGARETMLQLTERLEKKLQETPHLDFLKSYTLPGQTTILINLKDSTPREAVADCWYQARKKAGDLRPELPAETAGPYFDDEFGETYGIIYAFTGDGFSHRELKDEAERVRDGLLRVPDVAKVTPIGFQDERFYVEFSPRHLARLGIGREAIVEAVRRQNALTPSGVMDTGRERLVLETSGGLVTAEDLAAIPLYAGDRKIRLGDVAEVRRAYADPPQPIFRYKGQDAVALGVSMRGGGDVLRLERNLNRAMRELIADMPVGLEPHLVSNQPRVVREAVDEFMEALWEAVAIVLAVSFLTLGMRAGTVVACSIPLVLAMTFVCMELFGIDLQRVSLGALIISLGLLVDDATITVENMIARLEEGRTLAQAATHAYTSMAFPMLTGTLVIIFGFIPIGLAKSAAGEYTFSLFAVVGIALVLSWFVAVLFAPVIGVWALKERNGGKVGPSGPQNREDRTGAPSAQEEEVDPASPAAGAEPPASGRLTRGYHVLLRLVMRRPGMAVTATLALLALAAAALPLVPRQFFPPSERPELLVDLTLRQGASIRASDELSRRLDAVLAADPDVAHWSAYVGRGAVRFYLPLDEQLQNDFFTQTVVVAKSAKVRDALRLRLRKVLDEEFPEATARISALELGPPVGWPLQYRISGKDVEAVLRVAREAADIMATSPELSDINMNWGMPARTLTLRVRSDEARRLGLSPADIARTLYTAVSGVSATQVRDDIYLIDVILRADEASRVNPEELALLDLPLPGGGSAPLSAAADVEFTQDFPLIWRRDRLPTVTVQADIRRAGVMPSDVSAKLAPAIAALEARLPAGCRLEEGGVASESAKSVGSVAATLPLVGLLLLLLLMIQLENARHLLLVVCVAPLGLIGVVFALLLTRQPLGFVALLGVVALVGMIIRNSVILVHQIDRERADGFSARQAVERAALSRFRPITLTAVTAILGMAPIAPTAFWGPMANAVMGGLAVATALTLLFLPALYVLWLREK